MNLILHAGGKETAKEAIFEVLPPEPTKSWQPLRHRDLIQQFEVAMAAAGLETVQETHALARDGLRYFGLYRVADQSREYAPVIGLRNSNDRRFPASIVVGNGVFVCDNLAFSGEVKLSRRHTTFIARDMPAVVTAAVARFCEKRISQEARIIRYKNTGISNTEAHDIIIKALDTRAISACMVPHVLKQWRTPNHPEFRDRNAWSLFNAFTEVLKGNLFALPKRTLALGTVIDSVAGVALSA